MWEYYLGDEKSKPKHMRKFFSKQLDRLRMFTAIKKILMGHIVGNDEFIISCSDIDLSHYNPQDEDKLRKIYDRYLGDYKILD